MKTNLIIALFLGFFLASCNTEVIKPKGEIVTESYDLKDFTEIEAESEFQVYLTFSDTEDKLEIESNSNLHDRMIVEKIGNRLVLRFKNGLILDTDDKKVINAYITTSSVDVFEGSGASGFFLQNELDVDKIKIDLTGASKFEGSVSTEHIKSDASGASKIILTGSTKTLQTDLSGASTIEDYDFTCDHLIADLSGASKIKAWVNETLIIKASGASEVNYRGDGTVTAEDLSGASRINRN